MGLADGRCGQWLGVELGKRLFHGLSKLGSQHALDFLVGQAPDVRVQVRELGRQRVREEIAACGRDLAEFDEHPTRALQHEAHATREIR